MKKAALLLALLASPVLAADDPLTRPITTSYTDRWMQPRAPIPIYGKTWMAGSVHLNTAVIDTGAGLVVIDAGLPQFEPQLKAQIRSLGHKPSDVRYILVTEAHFDHAGGVAALARDTGATVIASPYTVAALRKGQTGVEDPQNGDLQPFPAPKRLRAVPDGGQIKLGDTVITARFTPGHTAGSTSWTWQTCAPKTGCRAMVFMASLSATAADTYRFSAPEHAAVVASFRQSFAKARAFPCDYLITGHPEHSLTDDKVAAAMRAPGSVSWEDKGACAATVARFEDRLNTTLAREAAK
ncbi:subclass B3 metallo-beta-lactamase [Novosphingobium sp. SG707]|uniref:subclass B3 metallo-beta-lactamase n=1 Tax=Novosphingobium sp. SG707 TaxID=2586996 RepID=UPI0014463929|nr:subclass B3 metallo-beta-lactamase [Novosphingobium sp. SG707]NKI99372.1 metallo-beta-lactamase class B [Novosphingobium sp. SG707]